MNKKVVAAFLAGALMMVSVQAFGDSVSQIGKKIQTELSVTVDGKKLTVPAIAVDGKSYAPVRAIGDAVGYNVAVSGKSIILSKEGGTVSDNIVNIPEPTPEVIPPAATHTPKLQTNESKINALSHKLATLSGSIAIAEAQLKDKPDNSELQQKVVDLKAQYAELQAQLAELQGQ